MFNVAIDGHAGSGKSSLAKGIAKRLGFKVLNTGAIYRAITCAYIDMGYNAKPMTEDVVDEFLSKIDTKVVFEDDNQIVYVNGKEYTKRLKLEETSILTAPLSEFPNLRKSIKHIQQNFAKENDCVMEGRDIGTGILPNAQVKFFVTASVEERARRRLAELNDDSLSLKEVIETIKDRDYQNETRKVAPLVVAKDAIVIDNTHINLEQTIDKCVEIIEKVRKN